MSYPLCPLFRLNTQTGRLNKKYHLIDLAFDYQFKTVNKKSILCFYKTCLPPAYSYQYYFQRRMHISNTWRILFPPAAAEKSWKTFGRAYIPETPGVSPNEEKVVEFCSEVLILPSTFQAAVGGRKKNKKTNRTSHCWQCWKSYLFNYEQGQKKQQKIQKS